jgi:hypothetical protein
MAGFLAMAIDAAMAMDIAAMRCRLRAHQSTPIR